MATRTKMSVIGGGSPFVLCLVHGLAERADRWAAANIEIDLSLFDLVPERAERWKAYGSVLRERLGLPLTVEVADTREQCLRDTRVALLSAGAPDAYGLAHRMRDKYDFAYHSIHDGPPGFAAAKRLYPFCREIGDEMARLSSNGLLLILPNPTDTLANAVARSTGANAVGMCVETEHSRDHLAHYLGVSRDAVEFDHVGVNHDGWITALRIDGEDGYPRVRDEIGGWMSREDFHPNNVGWVKICEATGYLRSSPYHNFPIPVGNYPNPNPTAHFGVSREAIEKEVDACIAERRVLDVLMSEHPERRRIKYFGTGVALEKVLWGRTTGYEERVGLQVRNDGAISNLPDDVQVEVPTRVQGDTCKGYPMGDIPESVGGITRLLAMQRHLEADWLLDGKRDTLLAALMTVPNVASVKTMVEYADELASK
ncbi:MAG: hypothetical protein O3A46_11160 [Candidatus Poribacteria bacterium]|nr:hypothetical protein [Candidatus Poribacteria bacterium]